MPYRLDYQSPSPRGRKPSKATDFLAYAAGGVLAILFWLVLLAWVLGLFRRGLD